MTESVRHANPVVRALVDRARSVGTNEKVISLMIPFWERNYPSSGPEPVKGDPLESVVRQNLGVPKPKPREPISELEKKLRRESGLDPVK
jgi:hypothetical protein